MGILRFDHAERRRLNTMWSLGTPDVSPKLTRWTGCLQEITRISVGNVDVYLNGGPVRSVEDGRVRWNLARGENTLAVRSRNVFGVRGPAVTATVSFHP
jgi:hypothetical protein